MNGRSVNKAAVERIYQEIKTRTISSGFPQDECYYPESFAAEFGVSRTNVRAALPRLAAEGLVITVPDDGFMPVDLSQERVVGKYELTRHLLSQELEQLKPTTRSKLSECEPVANALNELHRLTIIDGSVLATYTDNIFVTIASLNDNASTVLSMESANCHLRFIRTLESRQCPERVQKELRRFCELLLAGCCEELAEGIDEYHDRRVESLSELLGRLQC